MPQAMRRLCPTTTPGVPGRVTPVASRPGASRCAMYQMPGSPNSRCISFESSGLPEAVRLPAMAHAFDPGCVSPPVRMGNRKFTLRASPPSSMLRLFTSARHVEVRSRNMYRQISSESTSLHGRG